MRNYELEDQHYRLIKENWTKDMPIAAANITIRFAISTLEKLTPSPEIENKITELKNMLQDV